MLDTAATFSSFSVPDVEAARSFYADTLGLDAKIGEMGILEITTGSGARAIAYPKADHEPATFTILNFLVEDVSAAVDNLNARGVVTKIYTDPDLGTDEKGIAGGGDNGPRIAWFRDPAGNVLSVIEQ